MRLRRDFSHEATVSICTYPRCSCAIAWAGEGQPPVTICPRELIERDQRTLAKADNMSEAEYNQYMNTLASRLSAVLEGVELSDATYVCAALACWAIKEMPTRNKQSVLEVTFDWMRNVMAEPPEQKQWKH